MLEEKFIELSRNKILETQKDSVIGVKLINFESNIHTLKATFLLLGDESAIYRSFYDLTDNKPNNIKVDKFTYSNTF